MKTIYATIWFLSISFHYSSFGGIAWGEEETCTSQVCLDLSDELRFRSMNESVDPCDDFYEYVCGNWPKAHPMSVGMYGLGAENVFMERKRAVSEEIDQALVAALNSTVPVIQTVAQLYSDCLDTQTWLKRGVQPLIDSVEDILGDWPMLQRSANESSVLEEPKHWTDLFVNLFTRTGISPVFLVHAPLVTKSHYVFEIEEGIITLNPGRNLKNSSEKSEYREFLRNTSLSLLSAPDSGKLDEDIEAMVNLEASLHQAALLHRHKFSGTFTDLKKALNGSSVDWLLIVNRILKKLEIEIFQMGKRDFLQSPHLSYLQTAAHILDSTPLSVVQNWFAWLITVQAGLWTTPEMFTSVRKFTGEHKEEWDSNWKNGTVAFCSTLPSRFPIAMGRIYVQSHFQPAEKTEAESLVTFIEKEFRQSLLTNRWLDSETLKAALAKLDAIVKHVGYPDWLLSDKQLNTIFSHLSNGTVKKGKFFESFLAVNAADKRANLENLVKVTKNMDYKNDPTTVNAFYSLLENSIYIPAAILQAPFFAHNRPYSMNYGGIGTVIGHELSHGFDNIGRQYDLHGRKTNWWTNETLVKFNERAECFVKQYGTIRDPEADLKLNGTLCLAENIADNGGVRRAFQAYMTHKATLAKTIVLPSLKLNADQLFFVAYANFYCNSITPELLKLTIASSPHSPQRYRVNVVLGNTPQFAETFHCPVGTPMNPHNKCAFW